MNRFAHRLLQWLLLAQLLFIACDPAQALTRPGNQPSTFSLVPSKLSPIGPAIPESHPESVVWGHAYAIRYAYDRNRQVLNSDEGEVMPETIENQALPPQKTQTRAESSANQVRRVFQASYPYAADEVAIGSNENPLSLHKYLYCQANPVNGFDPSGHDDLCEMLTSAAIDSGLSSLVSPVISQTAINIGKDLIPQNVVNGIEDGQLPDAILFGGSGSLSAPVGKLPVGVSGGVGVELLWSPNTGNGALYHYQALGLAFGNNSKSANIQGYAGLVFSCPDSASYEGWFNTISIPYGALPQKLQSAINHQAMSIAGGAAISAGKGAIVNTAFTLGITTKNVLDKTSINIFWSPDAGGSWGFSLSSTLATTKGATSNFGYSRSYYSQFLPMISGRAENVKF